MAKKFHGIRTSFYSFMNATEMEKQLNPTLVGWANYFSVRAHLQAYPGIDGYIAIGCIARRVLPEMFSN